MSAFGDAGKGGATATVGSGAGAGYAAAGTHTPPVPGHSTGSNSKCHPWASGVTEWLTHAAAGLRPVVQRSSNRERGGMEGEAAAAVVCVAVRPLLDTVSATLPTPRGTIAVASNAANGTYTLHVPAGVRLTTLALPLAGDCGDVKTVTMFSNHDGDADYYSNGVQKGGIGLLSPGAAVAATTRPDFTITSAPWHPGSGLFNSYLEIDTTRPTLSALAQTQSVRAVQFRVQCSTDTSIGSSGGGGGPAPNTKNDEKKEEEEEEEEEGDVQVLYGAPVWDVPLVGTDEATHGRWIGKYGARGYQLFGLASINGTANLTEPCIVDIAVRGGTVTNQKSGSFIKVLPSDPKYDAALEIPCKEQDGEENTAASCATRGIGSATTGSIEPMAIEVTLLPALLPVLASESTAATTTTPTSNNSSTDHLAAEQLKEHRQQSQRQCVNITFYFVDWTGADDPVEGFGAVVRRKSAIDVFTVAPGLEIDVGYATAVVAHPQLAGGEYLTWQACRDTLLTNATGFAAVRFRFYTVTGFNTTVSAIFFD